MLNRVLAAALLMILCTACGLFPTGPRGTHVHDVTVEVTAEVFTGRTAVENGDTVRIYEEITCSFTRVATLTWRDRIYADGSLSGPAIEVCEYTNALGQRLALPILSNYSIRGEVGLRSSVFLVKLGGSDLLSETNYSGLYEDSWFNLYDNGRLLKNKQNGRLNDDLRIKQVELNGVRRSS